MLFLFYRLTIIMKISNFSWFFHKCVCVCFLVHSILYRNMCDKRLYWRLRIYPSPFRLGCPYRGMVRREVIPLIAEQSAILSIQNVSTLMCISGNGFVQSSEDNEV